MAKKIKLDFNKETNDTNKLTPVNKVIPMNLVQKSTSEEIANVPEDIRQFANIVIQTLHKNIGMIYNIKEYTKANMNGNIIYHINSNNKPQGGHDQILLTVTSKSKINIHFNLSKEEDYQSFYYIGEYLSYDEFIAEMNTIKTFLSNETPPSSSSKIIKESYGGDQDMDEYLADFEKIKGYVKK